MYLHEYQAKEILRTFGIFIPEFSVVSNREEALNAISKLGLKEAIVKAQVHAGSRAKAGAILIAEGKTKILQAVEQLIGFRLVNNQTGAHGLVCHKVLIEPLEEIVQEYYLAFTIDFKKACIVLTLSQEGGVDIEVNHHFLKIELDPTGVFTQHNLDQILQFMQWQESLAFQSLEMLKKLAKAFVDLEAVLLEINPLCLNRDGCLIPLDVKLQIDDNALFRKPELKLLYDASQQTSMEAQASSYGLSCVSLSGNIGCIVNGAGLAMATIDLLDYFGGSAANFLDVGGSATKDQIAAGLKILIKSPQVKAILINIFGGILSCNLIAEALIEVAGQAKLIKNKFIPVVVRMEGTDKDEACLKLIDSKLNIVIANNFEDAAKKAVIAAGII